MLTYRGQSLPKNDLRTKTHIITSFKVCRLVFPSLSTHTHAHAFPSICILLRLSLSPPPLCQHACRAVILSAWHVFFFSSAGQEDGETGIRHSILAPSQSQFRDCVESFILVSATDAAELLPSPGKRWVHHPTWLWHTNTCMHVTYNELEIPKIFLSTLFF